MLIEYEYENTDDEFDRSLTAWLSRNRIQTVTVNTKQEVYIQDNACRLLNKSLVDGKIPFKIAYVSNLTVGAIFESASDLIESFPKEVEGQLSIAMGRLPPGVTDLSFMGTNNKHRSSITNLIVSSNNGLTNLNGGPTAVDSFELTRNSDLVSLRGMPRHINENCVIMLNPKLKSLHNIHKYLHMARNITIDGCITSSILGVMLIQNCGGISFDLHAGMSPSPELRSAVSIINKALKGANTSTAENFQQCYEDLIEAGLDEYAKI